MKINKEAAFSISATSGMLGYLAMMMGAYKLASSLFLLVSLGGLGISWHYLSEKGGKPESLYALMPDGIRKIKSSNSNSPTVEEIAWGMATHLTFLPLGVLCWYKGEQSERRRRENSES